MASLRHFTEPRVLVPAIGGSQAGKDLEGHPTSLAMKGIFKAFGTTRAVERVDFTVRRAEIVGLMGGNGAGKSTLMKIVGGLIRADQGELRLFDQDVGVEHSPAAAMRLGVRFVHQELSLCTNLHVYENFAIELPDIIKGMFWR